MVIYLETAQELTADLIPGIKASMAAERARKK
jgi:hypothetical protein